MKERLDVLLVKRGLAESREKAKAIIMSGIVYVEDQKEDKAGTTFDENAPKEYYVRARGEVWARVPYRLTFRQERYLRSAQVEREQTGAYAAQSGQAQSEDAQSWQAAQMKQTQ